MPAPLKADINGQLADEYAKYYADPLGYVMFNFPWDTESSIQIVKLKEPYKSRFPGCVYGPDVWACKFLDLVGREVKKRKFDGQTPVAPLQFATASGHGIGKSTLVAMLIKWILDTRPYSKGRVTAGTDTQLRTTTWAEVGKWHNLSLSKDWFEYNVGRGSMSLVSKQVNPKTGEVYDNWRCDAMTSKKENAQSFAGLHAANSTPFYIFDEASVIDDAVYTVRDWGITDGEGMIFDFGNPVRNSGRFFEECKGSLSGSYIHQQIDSRDVQITNKEYINQQIETFGIESDAIKVRVLGQFPSAGSTQFIASDDVDAAMKREVALDRTAPLVLGVDVARFGSNESVIWPRVGMDARSWEPRRFRGIDTTQLTGKVIETIREFKALGMTCSAVFVDGGGIGGGVVDQLRHAGYNPVEVHFGGKPIDSNVYRYKGDEMWGRMRDALKTRLVLPKSNDPNGPEIKDQLTQREYGYTLAGNKIHLESKDDMAARLGNSDKSPDLADALALTFAQDVAPLGMSGLIGKTVQTQHDYDPLAMKE